MNFIDVQIGKEFQLDGENYIKVERGSALNLNTKKIIYLAVDEDLSVLEKEIEKFKKLQSNFPQAFLFHRFNTESLFEKLKEFGVFHSWSKEDIKIREEECKEEDSLDYSLCVGINESWGYIDIYYLYDLQGQMVITEINISNE